MENWRHHAVSPSHSLSLIFSSLIWTALGRPLFFSAERAISQEKSHTSLSSPVCRGDASKSKDQPGPGTKRPPRISAPRSSTKARNSFEI
ncbi:uncharacterized protein B0I36DRAFT_320239, partial [Microdochium trichocladiopsis]